MPWLSDPPTHPRPPNLRCAGERALLGQEHDRGPGRGPRTGRDALQIDRSRRDLTRILVGFGSKLPPLLSAGVLFTRRRPLPAERNCLAEDVTLVVGCWLLAACVADCRSVASCTQNALGPPGRESSEGTGFAQDVSVTDSLAPSRAGGKVLTARKRKADKGLRRGPTTWERDALGFRRTKHETSQQRHCTLCTL